jgi:ABC-type glycerol-3-phosphate transport system substrate-binding protein
MSFAKKVFLGVSLLVLTAGFVCAGGQKDGQSSSGTIRFSWWGNESRNQATVNAIRYYESKNPGITVVPEYAAYDGFYNKLMTQIAAGSAPDIFTMSAEWLPPVVEAGGCTDVTNLIDVKSHNPMVVDACSIDGKLYGVNVSLNANVIYYNKTLADELGIKMPAGDYTWDDLLRICQEVYQKTGGKTYGSPDIRMITPLETLIPAWTKTHLGKEPPFPWTNDKLIITGADIAAYMAFWTNAPQGVLLPPEETATLIPQVNVPIASRKTFLGWDYSGTYSIYQGQTKDDLQMIEYPHSNKGKGHAVSARPGLIEAVFTGSKNKPQALAFLNWFANDPEAGRILGNVRGVLPSTAQREAVLADPNALSDIDKKVTAITNQVYNKGVDPFSPGPSGVFSLFTDDLIPIGSEVAFKRITPQQAGQRFDEAVKERGF